MANLIDEISSIEIIGDMDIIPRPVVPPAMFSKEWSSFNNEKSECEIIRRTAIHDCFSAFF